MGEIQRQLGAGRTDQLIKDARGQNDRLQALPQLSAQRSCAERSQTDGNPRLRHKRHPQIIANLLRLMYQRAAGKGAGVFPQNTDKEIQHPDQKQRRIADAARAGEKRVELVIQSGAHKKQQQNRRTEIVELPEKVGVVRQIEIHNSHGHTAEQRRDIHRGADPAKRKQHRNGYNQSVIL